MIFSAPRGIARVFFVLGYLVAALGVAIFFYGLLSTMSESMQPRAADQYGLMTPDPSRIFRFAPIAFTLAIPGILVANLAALLGRHDKLWGDVNNTRIDRVVGGVNTGPGHLDMSGSGFQDIDQSWNQINVDAARYEIRNLRAEVLQLGISQRDLQPILGNLDGAERELQQRQPNARRVAGFLREATNLLEGAGAFAVAGQTLLPRLMELSRLLGFGWPGLVPSYAASSGSNGRRQSGLAADRRRHVHHGRLRDALASPDFYRTRYLRPCVAEGGSTHGERYGVTPERSVEFVQCA